MNKYTAKFAKLSAEQSKALSENMNAAYSRGGTKKNTSKDSKKPPTKKK